jgi:hypothetical protein
MKPNGIQLLDPFTVLPKTKVEIINNTPTTYKIFGVAVNILLSMSKIKVAMIKQKIR